MVLLVSVVFASSVGCSSIRGYEAESENPDLLEQLEDVVKANRSSLKQLQPSLNRHWRRDMAVLPYVRFDGTKARIFNVRDCRYRSEKHYQVKHFDRDYDLNELRTVDFIVVPFKEAPSLAHTMLSFGFANQDQVVISVEARLEEGETYSPTLGAMDQFELMYIVGTEQDLIRLRTDVRKVDVFLYRGNAKPELVKDLFTSMLARVNDLASKPEFYDTLKNNCTTNIVRHVNQLMPGKIPADLRVLFPGHSDKLAYDLDLIEKNGTFVEMRARSRINTLALLYGDSPDFSQKIRMR